MEFIEKFILKRIRYKNRVSMLDYILGLLYWIPIVLITNKWYKWMYGDYTLKWDIQYCIDNFMNMKTVWCFIVFGLITIVTYVIESYLLPLLFVFSKNINANENVIEKADTYVFKRTQMTVNNIYNSITFNEVKQSKEELMGIVVIVALWCVFIDKWYLYPLIPICFFIAYKIGSLIQSQFDYFNKKETETPQK
jgi:hypothetical protein